MNPTQLIIDPQNAVFSCTGSWTIHHLNPIIIQVQSLSLPKQGHCKIKADELNAFDSAGALCLLHLVQRLEENKQQVVLENFNTKQLELLHLVTTEKHNVPRQDKLPQKRFPFLCLLGKSTLEKSHQVKGFFALVGNIYHGFLRVCQDWRRFQFSQIMVSIHYVGLKALPILALLSFLIGIVLTYQLGIQLETYGANVYIAFLSTTAIFREFSPLITAIIVAGRTSSAFTAEIGSMKINEEIDAITTMGLSATELLLLPKIISLVLIFPLLIFWSDLFSTLGAIFMSAWMLQILPYDFLTHVQESVGLNQLMLGLYKAPAFAILIALVGCFQGLEVASSAVSLGKQTTKSVVQALFLIIITDAIYSIIYSWLDL